MATRHIVEEVEEPLEDVTADCFVYESDEVVSEESNDNGADGTETIMDGTHECDGGSSSSSSSSTRGLSALTEFLPLEKAKSIVWNHFGLPAQSGKFIQKDKRL